MKTVIKVKLLNQACTPEITENGDWIDLKSAEEVQIEPDSIEKIKEGRSYTYVLNPKIYKIALGVAMQLPDGYEAIVASRSSGPLKGYSISNGIGVIDNSYNGNSDEWGFIVSGTSNYTIHQGDRICQFRVQLSQKATLWQKIKWLLSSGVKLKFVDCLCNDNRGGFGSTGK